jgi:hypothetical protein
MRCRLVTVVVLALTFCVGAATVTAEPAHAFINPPPYLNPTYETEFWNIVKNPAISPVDCGLNPVSGRVCAGLWRMRMAGATLPELPVLGTIAMSGAAFALGWKIGRTIDTHFLHLSGDTGAVSLNADVVGSHWTWGTYAGDGFGPVWKATLVISAGNGETDNPYYCDGATSSLCAVQWRQAASAAMAATPGTERQIASCDVNGCRVGHYLTGAEMKARVRVDTNATFAGQPFDVYTVMADPTTSTPTKLADARAAAAAEPTTDTVDWINHHLLPGDPDYPDPTIRGSLPDCAGLLAVECVVDMNDAGFYDTTTTELGIDGAVVTLPAGAVVTQSPIGGADVNFDTAVTITANPDPLPIEMPQPGLNETYDDYLARLQDAGYVGTTTVTVLDTFDPLVGPNAISRLAPHLTPARVLSPSQWPTTGTLTRVWPNTAIDVWKNPTDAPPVPEGPIVPPPPGTGSCGGYLTATPDFTPITGIAYGSVFPFGAFTWLYSFVSSLDVSPVAPGVNIAMPSIGGHDVPNYAFNLGFFSTYMATIRTLLAFALWIGGIWFVGSSLLGFRATGNPTEAIDEGLNL